MKRVVVLLVIPWGVSCAGTAYYYPEEFSSYYRRPAEATSQESLGVQEIWYWAVRPQEARRIGYLEAYETQVQGSRERRRCAYITDVSGTERIGFISAENEFFRFRPDGRLGPPLGLYDLRSGLKVFFGYDFSHHIDLRELDPYR